MQVFFLLPNFFGAISAVKQQLMPFPAECYREILPRCLSYTRNLALVSKLAEADTANSVLTEVGVRSTADFASVVSSGGVLGLFLLLENH